MKSNLNFFCDPISKGELIAKNNYLQNLSGNKFRFKEGYYDFKLNKTLQWDDYYNNNKTYDKYNNLTFKIQGYDEKKIRKYCISKLGKLNNQNILEVGCGTGRDSIIISEKIKNKNCNYFLLDSSSQMLKTSIKKLKSKKFTSNTFILGDSAMLPFKDKLFDKIYSFTVYPAIQDKKKFFKEVDRVLKPGGKFVMVSEGMPDFLKKTDFGKIILNNSHLYNQNLPLDILPESTTNIEIEFILNEILFLISFTKQKTPRTVKEIKIDSKRGGTLNSRYYGKLEGVTIETKNLALKALDVHKTSMYDWLNDIIIKAANKTLNEK